MKGKLKKGHRVILSLVVFALILAITATACAVIIFSLGIDTVIEASFDDAANYSGTFWQDNFSHLFVRLPNGKVYERFMDAKPFCIVKPDNYSIYGGNDYTYIRAINGIPTEEWYYVTYDDDGNIMHITCSDYKVGKEVVLPVRLQESPSLSPTLFSSINNPNYKFEKVLAYNGVTYESINGVLIPVLHENVFFTNLTTGAKSGRELKTNLNDGSQWLGCILVCSWIPIV